jgi:malonyl-CoA O-methyltransferase
MLNDADFVDAITREGIVSRLEPLIVDASTILDLGSASGATGRLVRKRFRRAHVVALDLSLTRLLQARKRKAWFARSSFVQADAGRLPFARASFDVVVANQLLPCIPEPQTLLTGVARILRKGGLFIFATLGPGVQNLGDGLIRAGLRDPVLDVDRLVIPDSSDELEFVYGHCWGAGPANAPAVTHIDANRIPLRR